ncbi:MAG: hypothetical protein V4677_06030 [Bacteroidota bacterium]
MATLKPQNRKASKEEASDSTVTYVTTRYEAHDEYEREYFDNYDPDYYNHDEEEEDYTSWSD